MKFFIKLYHSVHLNLGIKRIIRRTYNHAGISVALLNLEKNLGSRHRIICQWLDNNFLLPLYKLFGHYLFKRLMSHYGADYRWDDQKSQNLDKNTNNLGYGYIHYGMIRNQRPKRVLCVGSMYGFIPYMMAKACEENQYGHVDFVDAGYDMKIRGDLKRHNYGQGFWKTLESKSHFKYLLQEQYISSHITTIEQFVSKHDFKYDYIYLDADHRYTQSKKVFKLLWPLLKEEGLFCLHDIHFEAQAKGIKFEHWKLWLDIVGSYEFKLELSNHYSGIGLVQKISKSRKRFKKIFL